jgi:hypothetical protein
VNRIPMTPFLRRALASLVMVASAWIAPSVLGYVFVVAQAFAVGVFAELQLIAVSRTPTPLTAAG